MITNLIRFGKHAVLGTTLLLFFLVSSFQQTKACDRTSFTLDSIVSVAGEYDIHTTLRIGAGITGSSRGAANNTGAFGFGFFSCEPNFQISSFTDVLVSEVTKVPAYGINVGSGFFGTQGFVFYQSYGWYTCISNTAYCGMVHTEETEIVFRVPELPDSILAYGLEGSGNPFLGCFGNADMVIDFGALAYDCPSSAAPQEKDPYALMPASIRQSMPEFLAYGYHPVAAEADAEAAAEADPDPHSAMTALDDPDSHSTLTALEDPATQLDLQVFPNPNNGHFSIRAEGLIQGSSELVVYNLVGKEMARQTVSAGSEQVEMQLNDLTPGMYLVRMEGPAGTVVRRFNVVK